MSNTTILIVILIVLLVAVQPRWGYSRGWGYGPTGLLGFLLVVALILLLVGVI